MADSLKGATDRFWREYVDSGAAIDGAERWLYGAHRLGDDTAEDNNRADDLALLVTRGIKTATCALLWGYEASHTPLPQVGALSIIENGRDEPVCIMQTTEMQTRPFRDIDTRFAYDNAEWDRSIKTWRLEYWQRFSDACDALGRTPVHTMPVICQRFRVLHPRGIVR